MNNDGFLTRPRIEIISGLLAGSCSTLVAHPLDVIKIRLQLSENKNATPFENLKLITQKISQDAESERVEYLKKNASRNLIRLILSSSKSLHLLQQYYRGLTPNLVGNMSGWSIYFALYGEFKQIFGDKKTTANYFSSSALAGMLTTVLTNPIWVLKTRILSTRKTEKHAYSSLYDGIRKIIKQEGIRSFWSGMIPSLFLVSQSSLQFTFYDHLKHFQLSTPIIPGETRQRLSTTEYICTSATSKIMSMAITYPFQVIRSNLQNYKAWEKRTLLGIASAIWHREGVTGFYKGISANMIRVVPSTCVTFVVYESIKHFLNRGPVVLI